jgi:hypothetical protein
VVVVELVTLNPTGQRQPKWLFCTFGQGVVNNMFADVLKLFEVLDMDDSFPTAAPCSIWIHS